MSKLETNIKAAELCGHRISEAELKNALDFAPIESHQPKCDWFTLDNATDLLATVIALGEKHHTDILSCSCSNSNHTGWRWYNWKSDHESKAYKEYKDAVTAAVDSIGDNE